MQAWGLMHVIPCRADYAELQRLKKACWLRKEPQPPGPVARAGGTSTAGDARASTLGRATCRPRAPSGDRRRRGGS
eukprot:11563-Chlamydomonas_euryale.AAC.6